MLIILHRDISQMIQCFATSSGDNPCLPCEEALDAFRTRYKYLKINIEYADL